MKLFQKNTKIGCAGYMQRRNKMNSLYKVWFEVQSDEEVSQKIKEIESMGYNPWDVYVFRFQGNDGRFHREVFVFA